MLIPSNYFKCLSDETRLRCMALLHQEGKLCVCELTHALELSQPKISRHLAQLRQCDLVVDSREGQWVYYRLNHTLPKWAGDILDVTIPTLKKDKTYKRDIKRLKMMMDRPSETRCPN